MCFEIQKSSQYSFSLPGAIVRTGHLCCIVGQTCAKLSQQKIKKIKKINKENKEKPERYKEVIETIKGEDPERCILDVGDKILEEQVLG